MRIWIDRCDKAEIAGWVDNDGPLPSVDILVNGEWVCSLWPNIYREDLEDAGLGDGRRAFAFPLAGRLRDGDNVIAICHSGAALARRVLRCGNTLSPDSPEFASAFQKRELFSVSLERWRGGEQAEGLTWGRLMT